jgi:hypothetical protein
MMNVNIYVGKILFYYLSLNPSPGGEGLILLIYCFLPPSLLEKGPDCYREGGRGKNIEVGG